MRKIKRDDDDGKEDGGARAPLRGGMKLFGTGY